MPDIQPLTPAIGAEVHGVDLREPLDDDTIRVLRDALHERKVLLFRDQDVTPAQQRDFAACFGRPQHFPFGHPPTPDVPEVMVLATDGDGPKIANADIWHSDASFQEAPPMATLLRAVRLPPLGGDTLFADMEAAYEALSAPLRRMLDGLRAEHDVTRSASHRGGRGGAGGARTTHPVVRTHPVTGRRCLYVNRIFTSRIEGLGERENEVLLPLLFEQAARPEFQCRFTWRPGSLALWDNRSAQHYAAYDYAGPRVMHRVVLEGEPPR